MDAQCTLGDSPSIRGTKVPLTGTSASDSMGTVQEKTMETYYNVFVRTWWRKNCKWPSGLEPYPGRKRYIARHVTYLDARELCSDYNSTHDPGRLSKKAEFEEAK